METMLTLVNGREIRLRTDYDAIMATLTEGGMIQGTTTDGRRFTTGAGTIMTVEDAATAAAIETTDRAFGFAQAL